MATIVTRAGKGSPLTHNEVDANFTNLNTDKAELASPALTGNVTVASNSATAAVTITQIGAGNALVVEDSASPDATPFVVTATGSVGIGTSSPAAPLTISALGNSLDLVTPSGGLRFYVSTTNFAALLGNSTNHPLQIFTNNTERMRIDASGNVGIGTTSPSSKLDVSGTVNATALSIGGTALTATAAELNFVDGVTSAIQAQLDAKAPLNSPNFTGPIGVGGANYGASGQVLTSGGAGVAPAWANQVSGIKEFTASGAITAGDIVGVNTDGTVSKRGKTNDVQQKTYALATTQRNVATSTQVLVPSSQYATKNSGVISLSDTTFVSAHAFGSTCVARITTLAADSSATFGSDFTALTGIYGLDQIIKVSADKFAIFYRPTSTTTGVIIGQVSGSTITFGSPVTFQSGLAMQAFGLSNGGTSILVVGNVGGTNTPLRAYALSVSGTTVTAGGAVTLRSAAPSAQSPTIAYDSVNNVFIINAVMISSPFTIVSWAASISGTTLTTGSQQSIFGSEAANFGNAHVIYDAVAGRFIVKNPYAATTAKENYYSATVSSLVITASPVNDTFGYTAAFFILTANGTLLRIDGNNTLYTISYDSANGYKPVFTALPYVSAIFATYSYIPIGTSGLYASIAAATNSLGFADAKVYTATFSDIASWIGSANETVSTGQSVDIAVSSGTGVGFSGLTAGTKYYITPLGTLVPESSTIGLAIFGTALSATTILLNPTLT